MLCVSIGYFMYFMWVSTLLTTENCSKVITSIDFAPKRKLHSHSHIFIIIQGTAHTSCTQRAVHNEFMGKFHRCTPPRISSMLFYYLFKLWFFATNSKTFLFAFSCFEKEHAQLKFGSKIVYPTLFNIKFNLLYKLTFKYFLQKTIAFSST